MITKSILQLVILVVAVQTLSAEFASYELLSLWNTWKHIYRKEYSVYPEESSRFTTFVDNYKTIVEFNKNSGSHPTAVKLALNKFADLTEDEFKDLHAGGYLEHEKTESYTSDFIDYSLLQLPSSVDWREKGAVAPVKNQLRCGSCWTFSTVGALESLYFLNHGKLVLFSEQQIVDCDTTSYGCDGGWPERALEYTAKAGLETEDDYPYTAVDGKCKHDSSKAIKVNSGHRMIKTKSASALKAALAVQPVSVAIEADQDVFRFYKSGVIKGSDKCGSYMNHAVLAVGYTTLEGDETFIIKNSWGTDWGANGYVHISTEDGPNSGKGVCGILGDPVVPIA